MNRKLYRMPADKIARLAALEAAMDAAVERGDAEAFRRAVNDDDFDDLLWCEARARLDDAVAKLDGDELKTVRAYAVKLDARLGRAYRHTEGLSIALRGAHQRLEELEARDEQRDEAIACAVAPLLERIAALEATIEEATTSEAVQTQLEAEGAKWALDFERRFMDVAQRLVDQIPRPQDGKDGAAFDGFDVAIHGRTIELTLTAGDRAFTRQVRAPFPLYQGVYRSGARYEHGDVVTYGGSQWIALRDTSAKPPGNDWRLCVAKGKDGKDAT